MEPVTDHHRRLLHQQVEAVTSSEAADTLMAHLPQGGTQALATKTDVALVRADLAAAESRLEGKIDKLEGKIGKQAWKVIGAVATIMLAVTTASITIGQLLK